MFTRQQQTIAFLAQPTQASACNGHQFRVRVDSSRFSILTQPYRAVTALVGLRKGGSQIAIAMLGDAKAMIFVSRGILPNIYTHPQH